MHQLFLIFLEILRSDKLASFLFWKPPRHHSHSSHGLLLFSPHYSVFLVLSRLILPLVPKATTVFNLSLLRLQTSSECYKMGTWSQTGQGYMCTWDGLSLWELIHFKKRRGQKWRGSCIILGRTGPERELPFPAVTVLTQRWHYESLAVYFCVP